MIRGSTVTLYIAGRVDTSHSFKEWDSRVTDNTQQISTLTTWLLLIVTAGSSVSTPSAASVRLKTFLVITSSMKEQNTLHSPTSLRMPAQEIAMRRKAL